MYAIAQFVNYLMSFGLPEGTPRQLLAACRVLAPLAAALWGVTIANIWVPWSPGMMAAARTGAAVTVVIGAMCWLAAFLLDRLDGALVSVICAFAERRAREARQHLQAARAVRPQGR